MRLLGGLAAAALVGNVLATPADASTDTTSSCKVVTFNATVTALNYNITADLPLGNVTQLIAAVQAAGKINVTATVSLSATYCLPNVRNSNNAKLQTFFGSITANRGDWDALGGPGTDFPEFNPAKYSWVQFANKLGYPTLAFDRLGTGRSSHPDPILVVQAAFEIELYNNIALQIRAGAPQLGKTKYSHLIYVGNSYGSQLGTGVAGQHPKAFTEFILTGYSFNAVQDFVGVSLVTPLPAAVVDPARFGTLPPAYLTTSSQVGRTNSFFGSKAQVSFEDQVAALFFQRKDVVSVGQFVSIYAYPFNGAGFTGRVFVLTGEQDQAFCGPGSPVIGPAMCGPQLKETGVLFPNANYNWKSVDKTGHAITLHNSAQKVFAIAHVFLAGQAFAGGPPA